MWHFHQIGFICMHIFPFIPLCGSGLVLINKLLRFSIDVLRNVNKMRWTRTHKEATSRYTVFVALCVKICEWKLLQVEAKVWYIYIVLVRCSVMLAKQHRKKHKRATRQFPMEPSMMPLRILTAHPITINNRNKKRNNREQTKCQHQQRGTKNQHNRHLTKWRHCVYRFLCRRKWIFTEQFNSSRTQSVVVFFIIRFPSCIWSFFFLLFSMVRKKREWDGRTAAHRLANAGLR